MNHHKKIRNEWEMIQYEPPIHWLHHDSLSIAQALAEAKGTILALKTVPYSRKWVERLQAAELKREVAGTSRIEGAEFSERELDEAMKESPEALHTRSQRQAHAAMQTYRWIATIPIDRPVDGELIREIHRRMVTGADDDHCPPGKLRGRDQNVNFGIPRHRGAEGGQEVESAFQELSQALGHQFREHDPIIQAVAAHYYLAAMHPFLDGNGRTARALEALLLGRAGLRDTAFVAMSNYYYEENTAYLHALAETRKLGHDLTPFLLFALKAVQMQGGRLLVEIQLELKREMFRNRMYDLFLRLKTQRTRVIGKRQLALLTLLLEESPQEFPELAKRASSHYRNLKVPFNAIARDLFGLTNLGAIDTYFDTEKKPLVRVNLDWPSEITDSDFFQRIKQMPQGKTFSFLRRELK